MTIEQYQQVHENGHFQTRFSDLPIFCRNSILQRLISFLRIPYLGLSFERVWRSPDSPKESGEISGIQAKIFQNLTQNHFGILMV